MGGLFRIDGKLMRYCTKLGYLIWLQLLTILCSLPIFTAGAALCAMHKVLLQIYRDTENRITKTFFASFLENFRQATILWLMYLVYFALLILDYLLATKSASPALRASLYFLPILAIAGYLSFVWIFPLQSRYSNTLLQTVKLSFTLVFFRPLTAIVLAVLTMIPVALLMLTLYSFPYLVFLGITGPGFIQALLHSRIFDYLEGTNWRKQQAEELIEQ